MSTQNTSQEVLLATREQVGHIQDLMGPKLRSLSRQAAQTIIMHGNLLTEPFVVLVDELVRKLAPLSIDRSQPFNPAEFIGKGWTIEEQDERSLALVEVDFSKVQLASCLRRGETSIQGEEKLKRLKQNGDIRLDATVFQALWENKHLIPESWKGKYVYFDGTILRDPDGRRRVLCLCWHDDQWLRIFRWLGRRWYADSPSAVLASN